MQPWPRSRRNRKSWTPLVTTTGSTSWRSCRQGAHLLDPQYWRSWSSLGEDLCYVFPIFLCMFCFLRLVTGEIWCIFSAWWVRTCFSSNFVLGMMSPADCRLPYLPGYGCCSCWVNVGDWQINGSIARHTYTCEFLVKYYIYIQEMHARIQIFWHTEAETTCQFLLGDLGCGYFTVHHWKHHEGETTVLFPILRVWHVYNNIHRYLRDGRYIFFNTQEYLTLHRLHPAEM